MFIIIGRPVKSLVTALGVIPVEVVIQCFQVVPDPGVRRSDVTSEFLRDHHHLEE